MAVLYLTSVRALPVEVGVVPAGRASLGGILAQAEIFL